MIFGFVGSELGKLLNMGILGVGGGFCGLLWGDYVFGRLCFSVFSEFICVELLVIVGSLIDL